MNETDLYWKGETGIRTMKKRIPINNEFFTYYNANPKGKDTCDCAIRAPCVAEESSYVDIYTEMFNLSLKTGYMIHDTHCIAAYLKEKGYVKCAEPRNADNTKMSVRDFLRKNPDMNCVAVVGSHHVVAIRNGVVQDIWDSTLCTMHTYYIKDLKGNVR